MEKVKKKNYSEDKETYFLVSYTDSCGNIDNEGVFTKKSFDNYLKERNKQRKIEGELLEKKSEFDFMPIEVY